MSAAAMFDLTGKIALITGANRGLGQGMALALAEAGADICAVGSSNANDTAQKVAAIGRRFHFIKADLMSSIDPIAGIVAETLEVMGGLDILVNNAGGIRRGEITEFSEQDWDEVMTLNLKSLFFMCQAAGKHMISQGSGKIINTASLMSFQGGIRVPSYTASKSGVAGITRLLANEWAAKGINVNAIAPGYMATELTEALQNDPSRADAILSRIPAARWGTPADVGGATVFLAAPVSNYVNGVILPVDGGWLAR
ncbi:2-dehydro-3-deoxy-D-gluconate 5-dehydrogenase KduD [Asticcacaulis sp. BYS171W]|uniref:2-dehydro-3-deoxy-D-gluconate 5-dehydrogenase KduD n=1 Tax=Asticcacaulis aquaticus TaxID=2984212 RepID=A0ABT5HVX5_9CAUL|nr:2-dehydro-3-deoxy-D-gluconate 5-dehydrogenase KduD [Asticcacaulis aquaticus]MDC7684194.1 2-dehydro-3-deoxy-D-gluconate 5-dehydrogenase KduD [Asticcacaulis aquaticus]